MSLPRGRGRPPTLPPWAGRLGPIWRSADGVRGGVVSPLFTKKTPSWKDHSPNFACTEFSEVRIAPVLCRAAFLCAEWDSPAVGVHKKRIIPSTSITPPWGKAHRTGATRLALTWGHGTARLLLGTPRSLLPDAATGSVDRRRFLDRRREEGEAPRRPHGRSFRPPRVRTLRAADPKPRSSLADRSTARCAEGGGILQVRDESERRRSL
jgi:hypothetical protein